MGTFWTVRRSEITEPSRSRGCPGNRCPRAVATAGGDGLDGGPWRPAPGRPWGQCARGPGRVRCDATGALPDVRRVPTDAPANRGPCPAGPSGEGDAAAGVESLEELPEDAGQVGAGVGAQCGGAVGEPGGAFGLGGPGAADPAGQGPAGPQVVAEVAQQPQAVAVLLAGGRGGWGGQVLPPGRLEQGQAGVADRGRVQQQEPVMISV
jgi:hypothetical protein